MQITAVSLALFTNTARSVYGAYPDNRPTARTTPRVVPMMPADCAPPMTRQESVAGLDDLVAELGLETEVREARDELAAAWQDTPGRALKSLRLRAGMRQRDLAERAKMTQSVVARIEGGAGDPQLSTLSRLATALGCSVAEVARALELDRAGV